MIATRWVERTAGRNTVRRLGGTLVVLAVLATGCGDSGGSEPEEVEPAATDDDTTVGDEGDADDWDSVIAAAEEEGELVVYLGPGVSDTAEQIVDEFESLYDIDVTLDIAHPTDHREKILAEQRSGRVVASLSTMGLGSAETLMSEGAIADLEIPNAENVREDFRVWDNMVTFYGTAYGFLVNTDVIDDPPSSWADLTDARFDGQSAVDDPRQAGGGSTWFITMVRHEDFGEDYLREIADGIDIVTDNLEEMVARGDYGLLVAGQARAIADYPTASLDWIAPDEGAVVVPQSLGLIADAPHPNAARLFANHLMEEESQRVFSAAVVPAIEGVEAVNPLFIVDNVLPQLPAGLGRDEFYRQAEDIFGVR